MTRRRYPLMILINGYRRRVIIPLNDTTAVSIDDIDQSEQKS